SFFHCCSFFSLPISSKPWVVSSISSVPQLKSQPAIMFLNPKNSIGKNATNRRICNR
ncbi:hypothetical protein EUTSA_v10003064mg, partial [Eutrema salsugineum]